MHELISAVTVVVELAIVGPLVSPTLYFVTHVFFPPEPLYAAGINNALNGSQSLCDWGEPSESFHAPPPPPAPEPINSFITTFFMLFVIVSS